MSQSFARHTISFVLRLWMEPGAQPNDPQWRGQLEHVGSGEKAHFQDFSSLPETVARFLPGSVFLNTIENEEEQ